MCTVLGGSFVCCIYSPIYYLYFYYRIYVNGKSFLIVILVFLLAAFFLMDWQKLFSNFSPIPTVNACDQNRVINICRVLSSNAL